MKKTKQKHSDTSVSDECLPMMRQWILHNNDPAYFLYFEQLTASQESPSYSVEEKDTKAAFRISEKKVYISMKTVRNKLEQLMNQVADYRVNFIICRNYTFGVHNQ